MRAATEWRTSLDRRLAAYRASWYLPQQYNCAALDVREALLDYQWAGAGDDERHAWAGMARPTRGHHQSDR
jgi:hypothetical protein